MTDERIKRQIQQAEEDGDPVGCARCGCKKAILYTWPGTRAVESLCSSCVSGLCEYCGERKRKFSVGVKDNWHLCQECCYHEKFKRKRRKIEL